MPCFKPLNERRSLRFRAEAFRGPNALPGMSAGNSVAGNGGRSLFLVQVGCFSLVFFSN